MTSLLSLKTDRPEFDTRSELGATTLCSFLASDPNKRIPNWLLDRPFKRPPPRHRRISGEKKIARLSKQPDLSFFFAFISSNPPPPCIILFFVNFFLSIIQIGRWNYISLRIVSTEWKFDESVTNQRKVNLESDRIRTILFRADLNERLEANLQQWFFIPSDFIFYRLYPSRRVFPKDVVTL